MRLAHTSWDHQRASISVQPEAKFGSNVFLFAERLHARHHMHILFTLQCTLNHTCRTQQLGFSQHLCSELSHAHSHILQFCSFIHGS